MLVKPYRVSASAKWVSSGDKTVHQCDHGKQYCIVRLKFAKRLDLKCSHHKKKEEAVIMWIDRYAH